MDDIARQPKGSPEGGQFASVPGSESNFSLTGGVDRSEQIVTSARHYLATHTCASCEAGRPCDAVTYAGNVLELDALIREFETEDDGGSPVEVTVAEIEQAARSNEAALLSDYVRTASTKHPDSSVAIALDLMADDLAKGSATLHAMTEAADVRTTPDRLLTLADHKDPDVQWWVAKNPNTPPAALNWLARTSGISNAKRAALGHPSTPVDALIDAMDDPDPVTVCVAARNPNLPTVHVFQLRGHPNEWVRNQFDAIMGDRDRTFAERNTPPSIGE